MQLHDICTSSRLYNRSGNGCYQDLARSFVLFSLFCMDSLCIFLSSCEHTTDHGSSRDNCTTLMGKGYGTTVVLRSTVVVVLSIL